MRSSIQVISIFLIIISLLFGCNNENKVINAELEKNKSKWQESKISNYDFVIEYTNSSNVFVPILVKVKNGQANSEEPFRKPTEYEKNETHENFNTVEKIFDEIQEAYNKKYLVEVNYNEQYGFPEKINLNSLKNAHSGISIEISKFEVKNNDKFTSAVVYE